MKKLRQPLLFILLLSAWTCEDKTGGSSDIDKIVVSPTNKLLFPGQTLQLYAMVLNESNSTLDIPVTWASSDKAIALVSDEGLVEAKSDGNVTITASAEGKSGMSEILISSTRRKILSELFTSST